MIYSDFALLPLSKEHMMNALKTVGRWMYVFLFGLAAVGCVKKISAPVAEASPAPTDSAEALDPGMAALGPTVDVGTDWSASPAFFETISFDYMKAELTDSARASLKKNAQVIKTVHKAVADLSVRVEGHCDDRGTLEYNQALGDRRARAVRDYYASLGVPKTILSTISFGEEKPLCTDASDECWAQNRRAETTWKAGMAVKVPVGK